MNFPRATYRVQLTPQFGFSDAARILPYLASLGVSTLYCSPILQARRGSTHGYDTTDPTRISEQLGGEAAWSGLCHQASLLGMTILLDIVPNHMATSLENPWWRNVLAHGRFSPYASYFDIDWTPAARGLRNRVLLPILDRPFEDAITSGVLKLSFDSGELTMSLGRLRLPLDVRSQGPLLQRIAGRVDMKDREEALSLAAEVETLWPLAAEPTDERHAEYERRQKMGRRVSRFLSWPGVESAVHHMLRDTTARQLRQCLRAQAYEVAWWKQAARQLNYRRFFDINDLIGMRVEDEAVFEATHATLRRVASDSVICGFRIDHIDGLRDPKDYLTRLRSLCGPDARFTVVEKILTGDEALSADWAVEGTTGYEFLSMVNGIFVDPEGLQVISRYHHHAAGARNSRPRLIYLNKRRVIKSLFPGEVDRLLRMLKTPVRGEKDAAAAASHLRKVVVEATARLPVYRTYLRAGQPPSPDDLHRLDIAISAEEGDPAPAKRLLRQTLVGSRSDDQHAQSFAAKWQQLTGAVMAKGFEDTTLYQDTTLLSLNDVGSRPDLMVAGVEEFHAWNIARVREWPHTLNCTATHDTKRGEDFRARLNVLTTLPHEWTSIAEVWMDLIRGKGIGVDAPMALLILQTMLGTWSSTYGQDDSFRNRMKEYVTKATREAKTHSSWMEPNKAYERSCHVLVDLALDDSRVHPEIAKLGAALEYYGSLLSLSQVLLKTTCPGIPDFYQGSELWDLSLVDPDNRRPVEFERRRHMLSALPDSDGENNRTTVESLVTEWPSERAKIFVTHRALETRARLPDLFQRGDYVPVKVESSSGHVCAFARILEGRAVVVAVPIRVAPTRPFELPMGYDVWGNTTLELPAELAGKHYRNALAGNRVEASTQGRLRMADITEHFPVVLLTGE